MIEKDIEKLQSSKLLKPILTRAKNLRLRLKKTINKKEIKAMLSFGDTLREIPLKEERKERVEEALKILLVSSAYYERLVVLRSCVNSIYKESESLFKKGKSVLQKSECFSKYKRDDKSAITNIILNSISSLNEKAKSEVETIDMYLSYLDKLQFNLKTFINYYKPSYGYGDGRDTKSY